MSARLLTIAEAREAVLAAARPLGEEEVPIDQALDRVLAADVRAASDVPPFACSAMDGYALRVDGAADDLAVVGESRAGAPAARGVGPGEAIRISTGAAVPEGAEAVVRQEDVEVHGDRIVVRAAVVAGGHIRRPGEDMTAGTTVLSRGRTLGAAQLGAAVSAGTATLRVARRPRVAVLSTGDELRMPGEPLGPGQIHNSNGPMLVAVARHCGALAEDSQRLPDRREETEAGLGAALARADVVVVCGGVSVGPHDHVKPALASLGVSERFWGVALQPGKPTWFGTLEQKLVFGLPGNPVSAFVTFSLFVRPALAALQGAVAPESIESDAELASAVRRNPAREQALRVRLERDGSRTLAIPNGPQGSHVVTSLLDADALALIPAGEGEMPAGSRVGLAPLAR